MSDRIRRAASVVARRAMPATGRGARGRTRRREPVPPSYVVFPGGAVDADDAALAARWFGRRTRLRAPRRPRARRGSRPRADRDGLVRRGLDRRVDPVEASHAEAASSPRLAPGSRPRRCRSGSTRGTSPCEAPGGLEPTPTAPRRPRLVGPSPAAGRVGGGRTQALLAHVVHGDAARAVRPPRTICSTLRFETREPDDDEVERLPRSVFWQD